MATTLIHSAKVLSVLVFTIFIAMVVFSSGVYYCESGDPESPQAAAAAPAPRRTGHPARTALSARLCPPR